MVVESVFPFKKPPNKACNGQVGTRRAFKHFPGFEFFRFVGDSRPTHLPLTRAGGRTIEEI